MKSSILLAILSIAFASCSTYQYLTVSGVDVAKKEKEGFVSENDTVKVQYNFKDGGKIGITIFNKTNEPIEVDWKKSAVIVGTLSHSYYNPNSSFSAQVQTDTARRSSVNSSVYLADIRGSIVANEAMSFIPPKASINNENNYLPVKYVQNLANKIPKKEVLRKQHANVLPLEKYSFKQEESPIVFRSYITFRVGQGAAIKEFVQEHHFYISEIWNTQADPGYFPRSFLGEGNRFYL